MTRRRFHRKARPGALTLIACLVATQAGAQAGGDLPTPSEIWRHLAPPSEQAPEPAPEPAAEPEPEPAPAPTPEPEPAPAPAPAAPPAPPAVPATPPSAPVPATPPSPPAAATPPGAPAAAARSTVPAFTAPAPSRTLAQARVVIHYPEGDGFARSQRLVALLLAAGAGEIQTRPVRYAVDRQSIRYYHPADREVTFIIADIVGGGGLATVSDFTFFRPSPRIGTVEIWLP